MMDQETKTRKCFKNLSRSFVIAFAIYLAIVFTESLNNSRVTDVTGVFVGLPVLMIFPTICHYKLVAKTQ